MPLEPIPMTPKQIAEIIIEENLGSDEQVLALDYLRISEELERMNRPLEDKQLREIETNLTIHNNPRMFTVDFYYPACVNFLAEIHRLRSVAEEREKEWEWVVIVNWVKGGGENRFHKSSLSECLSWVARFDHDDYRIERRRKAGPWEPFDAAMAPEGAGDASAS